jgi:hypothetical protein
MMYGIYCGENHKPSFIPRAKMEIFAILRRGGVTRYLCKKHFGLNSYPFAELPLYGPSLLKDIEFLVDKDKFLLQSGRGYLWIPEDHIEFITSNSAMKNVLIRMDD